MKKFLFALLIPFFANASTIEPDGNEIISLRYSELNLLGKTKHYLALDSLIFAVLEMLALLFLLMHKILIKMVIL